MKRIWHPYWAWEEHHAGMWRRTSGEERRALLAKAIVFTGDAALYGRYMRRVVKTWRRSCEHNLTERSMNRLAWVGHAACCLATAAPEDVTRQAWAMLTDRQREKADAQAALAVAIWETQFEGADTQLCFNLD